MALRSWKGFDCLQEGGLTVTSEVKRQIAIFDGWIHRHQNETKRMSMQVVYISLMDLRSGRDLTVFKKVDSLELADLASAP